MTSLSACSPAFCPLHPLTYIVHNARRWKVGGEIYKSNVSTVSHLCLISHITSHIGIFERTNRYGKVTFQLQVNYKAHWPLMHTRGTRNRYYSIWHKDAVSGCVSTFYWYNFNTEIKVNYV